MFGRERRWSTVSYKLRTFPDICSPGNPRARKNLDDHQEDEGDNTTDNADQKEGI